MVDQPQPVDPLLSHEAIVDARGMPTSYFLRKWLAQNGVNTTGDEVIDELNTLAVQVAANLVSINELLARTLTAGVGLDGGGDLSADRTFDLADTAVTPGTFGDATNVAQFTVDQQGRITAAADVAITGGGAGDFAHVSTNTVATAGDANIDFTLPDTYLVFKICVYGNMGPSNTGLNSRMSVDGGATFESNAAAYKSSSSNSSSVIGLADGGTVGAGRALLSEFILSRDLGGTKEFALSGTFFSSTSGGTGISRLIGGFPLAAFASGNFDMNAMQVFVGAGDMDDLEVKVWGLLE